MRLHVSLRWTTNLVLLLVYTMALAGVIYWSGLRLAPLLVVGLSLGVGAGVMQGMALKEKPDVFRKAKTMLLVRAAFNQTKWGRVYLRLFWVRIVAGGIVTWVNFRLERPHDGLLGVVFIGSMFVFVYYVVFIPFAWARELLTIYPSITLGRTPPNALP